jgi:hypothetical protein
MCDVTFYMMEGVNYARKKSCLSRKRVLRSPAFTKTRHYASMMSQASRIGSVIYQALPQHWRQGWMYRAFTGEALQSLKSGRSVEETTRLLWERYVEALNHDGQDLSAKLQAALEAASAPPKGTRKKKDPRVERLKPYSELLVEASRIASEWYQSLPAEERKFGLYRECVGEAMKVLKAQNKKFENQLPATNSLCREAESVRQPVSTSNKASGQSSRYFLPKLSEAEGSMRNAKNVRTLQVKTSLFSIPQVGVISPRRFVTRRKHQFRFVSRSP